MFARRKGTLLWVLAGMLFFSLAAVCPLTIEFQTPEPATEPNLPLTMTALVLLQTQMALQQTLQVPTATPGVVAPPTQPPALPTLKPTSSPLPTATQSLATPTASVSGGGLSGSATGNLYCRTGPAPYYPATDTLKSGDPVTVIARTQDDSDYWLVRTPNGDVCWVWGRWLRITGDKAALPVATAPPPPPGAFSIGLRKQATCGGVYYLVFVVVNRGPKPLESIQIRAKDTKSGKVYEIPVIYRNSFFRCGANPGSLAPGQEAEVWVPADDLSGRTLQVTAKACTKDDFQGECINRTPFIVNVP